LADPENINLEIAKQTERHLNDYIGRRSMPSNTETKLATSPGTVVAVQRRLATMSVNRTMSPRDAACFVCPVAIVCCVPVDGEFLDPSDVRRRIQRHDPVSRLNTP
jgi:hypothetical protein